VTQGIAGDPRDPRREAGGPRYSRCRTEPTGATGDKGDKGDQVPAGTDGTAKRGAQVLRRQLRQRGYRVAAGTEWKQNGNDGATGRYRLTM